MNVQTSTATASSVAAGHAPAAAIDADPNTWWKATSAAAQWLRVDLGDITTISSIRQSFDAKGNWKFRIEGSLDGTTWATLIDHTDGTMGQIFSESVTGSYRYVRLSVDPSGSLTASSRELLIEGPPEGSLISENAATTASSTLPGYPSANAVDSNSSTYWVASTTPYNQWLQIDMGAPSMVKAVEQQYVDMDTWSFRIEGSLDGTTWTMLMNNANGSYGQYFHQSTDGLFRYIRLTITGGTAGYWSSSSELKVYGFVDTAFGKTATASSTSPGYEPAKAVDGNSSTYWCATGPSWPQWLQIDLGVPTQLTRVSQRFVDIDQYSFRIEGSLDGNTWQSVADHTAGVNGREFSDNASGIYRYIKLTLLSSSNLHWPNSQALQIFGTPLQKDLARGASVRVSSSGVGYPGKLAVDGNPTTSWRADNPSLPQTMTVDLGVASIISRVEQQFVNDGDTVGFTIAGSLDGTAWTTLVDKSSGFAGRNFVSNVSGVYRYVQLKMLSSANGHWGNSEVFRIIGVGSPNTEKWWESSSGVKRYFPKYYSSTDSLPQITARLDTLKNAGYEALEIVAPYAGPSNIWAGLGATDNYAIDPSIGTMADFDGLIAAAHARGMKIIMMGNAGYAHETAPSFLKAQDDQRTNTPSKERNWYLFSATGGTNWYWSARANAYYYAGWDKALPSYNFHTQDWRDEAKKYLKYWMDKGLDGFILDAPLSYVGITQQVNNQYLSDVLATFDSLANPEGAHETAQVSDWNYNTMYDHSLTGWGPTSATVDAIDSGNTSGLEALLKGYRSSMNNAGGITLTQLNWEHDYTGDQFNSGQLTLKATTTPANKRLLEEATLAMTGSLFYETNGAHTIKPQDQIIPSWSATEQETFSQLIRAQNAYDALSPMGLRTKLDTNDNAKFYAFKRLDKAGGSQSLVILNYQSTPQTVQVNLTGSGMNLDQTPVDLVTGLPTSPINGGIYSVTLPAFGFVVLGVASDTGRITG